MPRKNRSFFQLALLRRRLFYEKIVQVEDNAKKKRNNNRVVPVEVKAEENVRARSLAQFVKDNPELKGLRISMKGYADQEWMENIPLVAIGAYFTPKT